MTLKDIAVLACRILSITTFIKTISMSHGYIYTITQQDLEFSNIQIILLFTQPVLLLLFSIILWCFAKNISNLMINDSARFNKVINLNYKEIKPIIFSIIGIILLTQAIPSFVRTLINIITDINKHSNLIKIIKSFHFSYLIEYILKILISLYLIIGPKKVNNFIKSTRSIGVTKKNDNDIKVKIIEK